MDYLKRLIKLGLCSAPIASIPVGRKLYLVTPEVTCDVSFFAGSFGVSFLIDISDKQGKSGVSQCDTLSLNESRTVVSIYWFADTVGLLFVLFNRLSCVRKG